MTDVYETNKTTRFTSLTAAMEAFERAAGDMEKRDYDFPVDDTALRDAQAPFRVITYDTDEEMTRTCPDYPHDCWREKCGVTWSTGGRRGGCIIAHSGYALRVTGM